MKLVPMPGVVLVEPITDDSIIQSTGRDYTNAAKVIAINPRDERLLFAGFGEKGIEPSHPKVGDIIFYDEYAYRRFDHEGKDIFAVDIRGEGAWIIGKPEQNDKQTEPMQTEGLPTPVPSSEASK